jgi:hypothetical protein
MELYKIILFYLIKDEGGVDIYFFPCVCNLGARLGWLVNAMP